MRIKQLENKIDMNLTKKHIKSGQAEKKFKVSDNFIISKNEGQDTAETDPGP